MKLQAIKSPKLQVLSKNNSISLSDQSKQKHLISNLNSKESISPSAYNFETTERSPIHYNPSPDEIERNIRHAKECAKFDEVQTKFKEIRFLDALNGF